MLRMAPEMEDVLTHLCLNQSIQTHRDAKNRNFPYIMGGIQYRGPKALISQIF